MQKKSKEDNLSNAISTIQKDLYYVQLDNC